MLDGVLWQFGTTCPFFLSQKSLHPTGTAVYCSDLLLAESERCLLSRQLLHLPELWAAMTAVLLFRSFVGGVWTLSAVRTAFPSDGAALLWQLFYCSDLVLVDMPSVRTVAIPDQAALLWQLFYWLDLVLDELPGVRTAATPTRTWAALLWQLFYCSDLVLVDTERCLRSGQLFHLMELLCYNSCFTVQILCWWRLSTVCC